MNMHWPQWIVVALLVLKGTCGLFITIVGDTGKKRLEGFGYVVGVAVMSTLLYFGGFWSQP